MSEPRGASSADDPVAEAASTPRPAAFFDVDNTIVRGASAFHLAVGLYRRGFFRPWDLVRFAGHQLRYRMLGENRRQIDRLRGEALTIMRGHSVAEVTAIAEDVYDEVLHLRIYPGTRALLDAHRAAGVPVWFVTASPREIAELLARRLGATGALCTVADEVDGFYTGRLVGDLLHGEAKARAVRELADRAGLDLAQSFAYGDSTNDVPLLSTVGHPCAINPDRRLRRRATELGWPMRDFRPARHRVRRGARAATCAGTAWALAVTARAARRALTARTDR
ncbi:MAG: HAD-IB family hydrolase [Cellulomonas sp.]|uniref:HAD family hydrolase n=1 Tax=Cellulomonas sp. TaxID=40001 RepID=UPI002584700E|nr:HAD-IB family hydrolase [Cellulomonas sp.]MCR6704360.1 HAD-IB family hydrolase [Cellulomonas sp.]